MVIRLRLIVRMILVIILRVVKVVGRLSDLRVIVLIMRMMVRCF